MAFSAYYPTLRRRFRLYLNGTTTLRHFVRTARYALLLGPWRQWFVRYFQSHSRQQPMTLSDRSLFADLDADRAVRQINDDSYAPGLRVPESTVEAIVEYSRASGTRVTYDAHLESESIRAIAHDPKVIEVARKYLGAEPILCESTMYWTYPPTDGRSKADAAADHGRFHFDLGDWKSIVVFVYLTDVDEDCWPHIVVRGTHSHKSASDIMRRYLSDEEARARFGERIQVITGEHGTGWFEDVTCFHKQSLGDKPRLMLTLVYSLHRRPRAAERKALAELAKSGAGAAA